MTKKNKTRAKQTPLAESFIASENLHYNQCKHETLYTIEFGFFHEFWASEDITDQEELLKDIKERLIGRLHDQVFGEIESIAKELQFHIQMNNYRDAEKCAELLLAAIKGED